MSEIIVYLLATIVIVIVLLLTSRIAKLKDTIKDLKEQRSMYVELNLELRNYLVYYCDGTKITKFKPCYNNPNQVELNSQLTLPVEQVKLIYDNSDIFLSKVDRHDIERYRRLVQDTHIKDMIERWVNTSDECYSMFLDKSRISGVLHNRTPNYVNLDGQHIARYETTHVLSLLELQCDDLEAVRSQLIKLTGYAGEIKTSSETAGGAMSTLDKVKWDSFMEAVKAACEECKKIAKTDVLFHIYNLEDLSGIEDYRNRLKSMAIRKIKSISQSDRLEYAAKNHDCDSVPDTVITDVKGRTIRFIHSTRVITKVKLSELSRLYLQEDLPV